MMSLSKAVTKINERGVLLVFPIKNAKEPRSLWSEFYPRSKMIWEWDDDGDGKVHDLWFLMKKLSACRKVVYSKWYQNRATFFSIPLFTALIAQKKSKNPHLHLGISRAAREILDILEADSPLSTKQIKKLAELQGKDNEPQFQRAMKELFSRFLIVAFGEVDDGAFPSLAVGSTRLLFEDIWLESEKMDLKTAQAIINKYMPPDSKFGVFFEKQLIVSKN